MTTCRCGHELRIYTQGSKPARVNGVIVFTDTVTLAECRNPECPRRWITRELTALLALTDEQAAEYQTEDNHVRR